MGTIKTAESFAHGGMIWQPDIKNVRLTRAGLAERSIEVSDRNISSMTNGENLCVEGKGDTAYNS